MTEQLATAPRLAGPVGRLKLKGRGNHPVDVKIIQKMLNIVLVEPKLAEDGEFTDDVAAAIEDFQSTCIPDPDGLIAPHGSTIDRLVTLAVRGKLHLKIHPIRIDDGAYRIAHNAKSWKSPYQLHLCVRSAKLARLDNLRKLSQLDACLNVSSQPAADCLDKLTLLPKFLELLEALGDASRAFWSSTRWCALYVARGDTIVARAEASFKTPLEPYTGTLAMEELDSSGLPYELPGCVLNPTPFNGRHYFRYAGRFGSVGDPPRGLNCISYPLAVYRLVPHKVSGKSGYDGEEIADDLAPGGNNDVDDGSYDETMEFFANHRTGAYLMWYDYTNAGHTVLVVDGIAHEWSHSHGGYRETPIPVVHDPKAKAIWGNKTNARFNVRAMPRP